MRIRGIKFRRGFVATLQATSVPNQTHFSPSSNKRLLKVVPDLSQISHVCLWNFWTMSNATLAEGHHFVHFFDDGCTSEKKHLLTQAASIPAQRENAIPRLFVLIFRCCPQMFPIFRAQFANAAFDTLRTLLMSPSLTVWLCEAVNLLEVPEPRQN